MQTALSYSGPDIRTAIVEDDPTVRNGLQMLINGSQGFVCPVVCGSGEEALVMIPPLNPDVVLMDINLPGIDGIETLVLLRSLVPGIQCIILTVFVDTERIFKSLAAGAIGYLLKQTPPARLLEAIIEVRQGGSPMSGEIARKVVGSFQEPVRFKDPLQVLTKREEEILALLAKGFLYKEISDCLFISVETVRTHIRNIYEKLQVRTRTEAILKFFGK